MNYPNCKDCNEITEDDLKYLAYKPVYWKKCANCIKKMWLEFRDKDLIRIYENDKTD